MLMVGCLEGGVAYLAEAAVVASAPDQCIGSHSYHLGHALKEERATNRHEYGMSSTLDTDNHVSIGGDK